MLGLPSSWILTNQGDEFTTRMFRDVNGMTLDVLAAEACKDYDHGRRRQAQSHMRGSENSPQM